MYETPNGDRVGSYPVQELDIIRKKSLDINRTLINVETDWTYLLPKEDVLLDMELVVSNIKDYGSWEIILSNDLNEQLSFGFDDRSDEVYIDRTKSGNMDFSDKFSSRDTYTRFNNNPQMATRILIDRTSIELFADLGQMTFTEMFYPTLPYDSMTFRSKDGAVLVEGVVYHLKSIWTDN
jgi:sucrose-6-phosphate hydrolase SacC (GH32 family)